MAKLDIDLPPSFAEAIGYVAAYCSLFESVIEESIWGLLGLKEDMGRAVTSELMLTGKMNMLLTVAQEKIDDETLIGDLKALHKKTLDKDLTREDQESLNKRRNRVIHCRWHVGLLDDIAVRFGFGNIRSAQNYRARGKVTPNHKAMSDSEILKIAESFALTAGQLDDWTQRALGFLNKQNQEDAGAP